VSDDEVILNSLSTTDANELYVNYTVDGGVQQSFQIDIYRSDQNTYSSTDMNNVEVASYQVAGGNFSQEGTITINSTMASSVGVWGMNGNTLSAPLVPDPALPYVLAVADPQQQLPAYVTTNSSQAYFHIYTIAAVTHGQEWSHDSASQAPWVGQIADGLKEEGYTVVLPIYWDSLLPAPGQTTAAGTDMYNQIIAAAQDMPSILASEQLPALQPNDIIDVQLIGHSRGASVIGVAMNDLVNDSTAIPQLLL
jgi:hypothetical protein